MSTNVAAAAPDAGKLRREEERIRATRERYQAAQQRHSRGELSDRDLALFHRDLMMAEARGHEEKVARAHYDFLTRDYRHLAQSDPHNEDALYKAEQEINKAQHAIERAKATNEMQKAFADLKYTERALGSAQRRRDVRIERDGIVTNFISPEALKKLEYDHFYSELDYQRLKQKENPNL